MFYVLAAERWENAMKKTSLPKETFLSRLSEQLRIKASRSSIFDLCSPLLSPLSSLLQPPFPLSVLNWPEGSPPLWLLGGGGVLGCCLNPPGSQGGAGASSSCTWWVSNSSQGLTYFICSVLCSRVPRQCSENPGTSSCYQNTKFWTHRSSPFLHTASFCFIFQICV